MARIARVVAPGLPHHITQRGNRRQRTFFRDADYRAYLELMAEWCARRKVEVWAYCLMPNHVHLIAAPKNEDALRAAIGETHRRYTRMINFRRGWRGCLWQGRFASYVLDNDYLRSAVRYVALNPVRAGLAERAEDWPWSSAATHLGLRDGEDPLVNPATLLARVEDFADLLLVADPPALLETHRRHERTGRPLGSKPFVRRLEKRLGRPLLPRKPGPRKKGDK